jgi:hypothetical protein
LLPCCATSPAFDCRHAAPDSEERRRCSTSASTADVCRYVIDAAAPCHAATTPMLRRRFSPQSPTPPRHAEFAVVHAHKRVVCRATRHVPRRACFTVAMSFFFASLLSFRFMSSLSIIATR